MKSTPLTDPQSQTPRRSLGRRRILLAAALLTLTGTARAATVYWDGSGTDWSQVGPWSTAAGATTPNPTVIPGSGDTVVFNITGVTAAQAPQLNGDQAVAGISVLGTATGGVTITGGNNNHNLTIGATGITIASGAGAVTIGSSTAGQNVNVVLAASQSWANNSANLLTIANGISSSGAYALTFNGTGNGNVLVNGVISNGTGTTSIVINNASGTGVNTFSNANTYSGSTTLTKGTLKINAANNLGDGSVTNNISMGGGILESTANTYNLGTNRTINLTAASTIQVDAGALTVDGIISSTAGIGFSKTGVGSLTLSNANTYSGSTTIGAGTVLINASNNLGSAAATNTIALSGTLESTANTYDLGTTRTVTLVADTSTIQVDAGTLTVSGVMGGGYALTKAGAGTLTLSGASNFGGTGKTFTLSAGTLNINNNSALGQGSTFVINGGTTIDNTSGAARSTTVPLTIAGNFNFSTSAGTANNNLSISGATNITADATVTLNGAGVLTTGTVTNTVDGVRTLTVNIGSGTTATSALTLGGYTLTGAGSTAARSQVIAGNGNVNISGLIANGVSAGSGITYNGTGVLSISGSNTFTGGVIIASGTVKISGTAPVGTGSVTIGSTSNSAVLDLNGSSISPIYGLSTAGTAANQTIGNSSTTAAATLLYSGTTGTSTFGGVIKDAVNGGSKTTAVTVAGLGGALTLTNVDTYTGATTVTGGKLTVSGAGTIANSGSVSIGNVGAYSSTFTSGTLALDNTGASSASVNRLLDTAAVSLNRGGVLSFLGSDQTGVNSSEAIGAITLSNAYSTITVNYVGSNTATLTAAAATGGFTRAMNTGGIALINGTNLGLGSAIFKTTTAPTFLVGTTAATTGINSSAKNTKIIPFLLGESGTATGNGGASTGVANTFLTYNATNGYRPLNPTDEFSTSFVAGNAGNNFYVSTSATANANLVLNSLVINGADLAIANNVTLTNTSGAVLFVTSNAIKSAATSGTLAFSGSTEAIISVDAGQTGTISSALATGTAGMTIYGPGTLALTGTSGAALSGTMYITRGATLLVGSNYATGSAAIMNSGMLASSKAVSIAANYNNAGSAIIGGNNDINLTGTVTGNAAGNTWFTNTGTTTISGPLHFQGSASSTNFYMGNSSNLVISGSVWDSAAGNVSSGNGGNFQSFQFFGVGSNLKIVASAANSGYGANMSFPYSSAGGYNTITIATADGNPGTVSPFGKSNFSSNTNSFAPYFVAANDGVNIANNFTFNQSVGNSNAGLCLGFDGTHTLTLSGTVLCNSIYNNTGMVNLATAAVTFTGTTTSTQTAGVNQQLYIIGGPGSSTVYSPTSSLIGTSGTAAFLSSIAKYGPGGLTLSGVVSGFTGSTTLYGGTVILDYSASSAGGGSGGSSRLVSGAAASSALTLGGVNLQLQGGSFVQNLGLSGTTALAAGQSKITQTSSGSSKIQLAPITRSAGGVIDFGTGAASVTTANTAGIMGAWATVGGADWAVSGASSTVYITALGSYDSFAVPGTNKNVAQGDNGSVTVDTTINTLKLTTSTSNQSLAITAGKTLTLTTGGLLFTGANNYSITGGTLKANSNGELVIQQYGAGVLQIDSLVANGTGAVNFAGTGNVKLTNANTYTGANYLNGGTVQVSSDGNLGSGGTLAFNGGTLEVTSGFTSTRAVTLNSNGGTFQVDANQTLTMNGVISSLLNYGALNLAGSGTMILNASNTYLGATNINGGTLKLGNVNALGPVAYNIFSGGANNRDYSPINVAGGTLDIAGYNVSVGNVVLTSGSITDSTGTGSVSGFSYTLLKGTVSAVLTDMAVTNSNVPTNVPPVNSINLSKTTADTVILSGNNTYTGNTNISAGILQIGDGVTSGKGQLGTGAVSDNATLAFNRPDSVTINNEIYGTGGLTQMGAGTVILTGTNSYAGTTTINSGCTLQVGAGGIIGTLGTGNVTDNGTLAFSHSDAVSMNNIVSGTGGLTQAGLGLLSVTNVNTYSGATTVSSGTLAFSSAGSAANSSMFNLSTSTAVMDVTAKSGTFTVGAAQTLTGIGTVNAGAAGVGLNISGTFAPGNGTVGTHMTVKGDLDLGSTSTTVIKLGASYASTSANVNGYVNLDGALSLSSNGSATAGRYTIISGAQANANGNFASIANISGYRATSVSNDGTGSVYVDNFRLASAAAIPTVVINTHEGVAGTNTLSLTNNASTAGDASFVETLASNGFTGGTAHFSGSGAASGIASGDTNSTDLTVGVDNTLTAGQHTGTTTLALNSEAVGTGAGVLSSTSVGTQTVNITANVYRYATSDTTAQVVNFGTIHTGDTGFATQNVSVANTATTVGDGTYNETLKVSLASNNNATVNGSIGSLVSGSTDSTSLSVNLAPVSITAGIQSGTATLAFTSNDKTGLGDTSMGAKTLQLTGTVNDYAKPTFTAGTSGSLTKISETSYTLNLGSFTLASGTQSATINLTNEQVSLFQDSLNGTFNLADMNGFTLAGSDPSALVSGSSLGLTISFDMSSITTSGSYSGILHLTNIASVNASGTYALASGVSQIDVNLELMAVPEPSTYAMVIGGFGVLVSLQRMRRRRE